MSNIKKKLDKSSKISLSTSQMGTYIKQKLNKIRKEFTTLFLFNDSKYNMLITQLQNLKKLLDENDINKESLFATRSALTYNDQLASIISEPAINHESTRQKCR